MKLVVLIALLGASVAFAQAPATPAAQPAQLRAQSTVVLVPALVRNAHGELVFTLKADDFTVTDDGVEQQLTLDEDTGGEPLALVVAVETGRAGAHKLDAYRNLDAVIAAVVGNVPHRVAVVGFDSAPTLLQGFTSDVDVAGAALRDLEPGDKGAAILDGLKFSVDLLRSQPPPWRRAILLISETVDHGSQTTMDDALRAIGDTNTAIYSVAFSSGRADATHYADRELPSHSGGSAGGISLENAHPGPPHGCMGKDPDPDATQNKAEQAFDCLGLLAPPLALAKLAAIRAAEGLERNVPETVAQLTGGEYFKFENSKSLERDLLAISNHMPNRYVLSFHPQSPHPGFHSVELRLKDHPGLRVTARSGYWADSDAAATPQP
ncbi:MAG: VWA domain-containing protein [Terracidiphilus sp.]|jgi:VWFA-related protein